MERNGALAARKDTTPTLTPADDVDGALPAELRFLAAQTADTQERERIVRAYYTFAHGTPDSSTVQFALLAAALLRANLSAAQDVADQAERFTAASASATAAVTGARPAATPEEITAAVRQALGGLAEGLNVLSGEVASQAGGRWTAAGWLLAGIVIGYALARF